MLCKCFTLYNDRYNSGIYGQKILRPIYIMVYLNEFKLCFNMMTYRIMCSYPWVLRPLISDIYPALALVTDLTCTNISTGGCLILFLLPGHCKEKHINNT